MNVGLELGVKIGRPLMKITVSGYADFFDKMTELGKQGKNLCK